MNGAQLHLLLNHFPVITPIISILVLGTGWFLKNKTVVFVGLAIIIGGALLTVPAYLSGEPAEEIAKKIPGVEKAEIHEHEEAAEAALIAMSITGIASLTYLIYLKKGRELNMKHFAPIIFLLLLSIVISARTAHIGGEIRHPEIEGKTEGKGTGLEQPASSENHKD